MERFNTKLGEVQMFFIQHPKAAAGVGTYYTSDCSGFFGSPEEPDYYFIQRINDDGEIEESICGTSQGSFWTDWR